MVKNIVRKGNALPQKERRNFQYMLLGSTSVWQQLNKQRFDLNSIISYAFYKRSLYADFLILKHKFSYLTKRGEVLITVDCKDIQNGVSGELYFPDYLLFHPITINSLGLKPRNIEYIFSFPMILRPLYSTGLLFWNFFGCRYRKSYKPLGSQKAKLLQILSEMIDFSLRREITPQVFFLNYSERNEEIAEIESKIRTKFNTVKTHRIFDLNQMFKTL